MPETLENLVEDYKKSDQFCGCIDEIQEFENLDLNEAIPLAACSYYQGKKHSHQWRLTPLALETAERALMAKIDAIGGCKTFDELHYLVANVFDRINGAGELYAYDVAHRIGHSMQLKPEFVYLHAGTRKGASYLGIRGAKVLLSSFPKEMHSLEPAEAEDFLCIYKNRIKALR